VSTQVDGVAEGVRAGNRSLVAGAVPPGEGVALTNERGRMDSHNSRPPSTVEGDTGAVDNSALAAITI